MEPSPAFITAGMYLERVCSTHCIAVVFIIVNTSFSLLWTIQTTVIVVGHDIVVYMHLSYSTN